jgi:hypothetical protein
VGRRLDLVHEVDHVRVEALLELGVGDPTLGIEGLVAWASENMSGYSLAPRCSSGTRRAHSPRLPPDIDGDADISSPARSLNGCGLRRDTQSIEFLSTPGIEALYSGAATTNPLQASRQRRNSSAPSGNPSSYWTSVSYEGVSKSRMDLRSTSPSLASMVTAARRPSSALSDPSRSDAEKTRNRMGSRCCASGMVPLPVDGARRRRDLDADPSCRGRPRATGARGADGRNREAKEREEYPER